MSRRLQRTAAWLVLVAYTLAGIAPARGLVLCLGPDGHLAIEFEAPLAACGGCLDDDASPNERGGEPQARLQLQMQGADCPCVDVPLSDTLDALRRCASESESSKFAFAATPLEAPPPLAAEPPVRSGSEPANELRPGAPPFLRSVVLLV